MGEEGGPPDVGFGGPTLAGGVGADSLSLPPAGEGDDKTGGEGGPVGMSVDELTRLQKEEADAHPEPDLGEPDELLDEEPPVDLDELAAEGLDSTDAEGEVLYGTDEGAELTVAGAAEAAEAGVEKEFSYETRHEGEPDLECPECGGGVWTGDTACPNCGIEFDLSEEPETDEDVETPDREAESEMEEELESELSKLGDDEDELDLGDDEDLLEM
jgi:hypothetical protein